MWFFYFLLILRTAILLRRWLFGRGYNWAVVNGFCSIESLLRGLIHSLKFNEYIKLTIHLIVCCSSGINKFGLRSLPGSWILSNWLVILFVKSGKTCYCDINSISICIVNEWVNIVIKYIYYRFIKFNKRCLLQIKRNLGTLSSSRTVSKLATLLNSSLQLNP